MGRFGVLIIVIFVAAGCSSNKPAPQPSAMSVAAYDQVVNGISGTLTRDTAGIDGALTPAAVGSAITTARGDTSAAVSQLQHLTAPAQVKTARAALISALRAFGGALGSAATAASTDQVCAGSSALAMLSRSSGAAPLRSALGSVLPPTTADTTRRLANGALIKRPVKTGLGELTIINNGGTSDAVVELARGAGTAEVALYVRAGSTATVKDIGDGNYQAYFTGGVDWDAAHHLFTRSCGFQKFDTTVGFTTTTHGDTTQYVQEELTLTQVVNGNVQTSKVPAEQFPQS